MRMYKFDAIDKSILNAMQSNGRVSNADLAEQINLSPSACLRRVRRLEDAGVIEGYATLSSQSEYSLNSFENAVAECPEVMECYLMAGDSDYLLRVVAADAADYERIHKTHLSRLPNVSRIRSQFTLRAVCKKTAFQI